MSLRTRMIALLAAVGSLIAADCGEGPLSIGIDVNLDISADGSGDGLITTDDIPTWAADCEFRAGVLTSSIRPGQPAESVCRTDFLDVGGEGRFELEARASLGSTFLGWSGDCTTVSGAYCTVVFEDTRDITISVAAEFEFDTPLPTGTKIVFSTETRSSITQTGNYHGIGVIDESRGVQFLTGTMNYHDVEPGWSPDQSMITFVSDRGGSDDIYVMNADGSNVQQLTSTTSDEWDPKWSPDGAHIAFVSDREGGNEDLYVMNSDGTGVQRLTTHPDDEDDPAWSPDGTKIVFAAERNGFWGIHVIDSDGQNEATLTNHASDEEDPSWSPDGNEIAFASSRDGGEHEIYVMDTNGTNPRRLTLNPASDDEPTWSADGTRIAFVSERREDKDLYMIDASGANEVNLTYMIRDQDDPDWYVPAP